MTDESEGRFMKPPKKIDTALVTLAAALLVQAGSGVWFAATLNSRVERLEESNTSLRAVIETVARLDERTKGIERIERKLDALDGRP